MVTKAAQTTAQRDTEILRGMEEWGTDLGAQR